MVLRHFKLREQPFGVTPDPRFIYASATHQEALSSLLYGIEAGVGFITLTGSPGTGKTTILFEAMRRLRETTRIAFLFQTISTPAGLFRSLLIELGVKDPHGSLAAMQAQINEALSAQSADGKRLVVVIDEAQNLGLPVLEAVRMLSNFETASHKLVQIILAGQPQLEEKLALPRLLQLRQRISIFGNLQRLSAIETQSYIHHRLRIAGHHSGEPLFTAPALELIARHSEGMPRNINNICFNALSLGYALERRTIDSEIIKEVIADLGMIRPDAPVEVRDVVFYEKPRPKELGKPTVMPKRPTFQFPSKTAARFFLLALVWLALRTSFADNPARASSIENRSAPVMQTRKSEKPLAQMLRPPTRLIEIHEGDSLYKICARSFGVCSPTMLEAILRINSSIRNPNHIETGQIISVPVSVTAWARDN